MKTFLKKIITALLWAISKLPFGLLYIVSSAFAWFIRIIVKYRKSTIIKNLDNAFPEKSEKEKKFIRRQFYKNFSDFIIEVIKTRSITQEQLSQRIKFNNYQLLDNLYKKKKSVIVVIGHCGNFEWTTNYLQMISPYKVNAIVKPLKDPFFENYLKRLRGRFKPTGELIPLKNAIRMMVKMRNELTITVIAGDQTPPKRDANYWTKFLNQETPVFTGIEKLAVKLDHALVFFDIQRERRGKYVIDISLIEEHPTKCGENEITEKHVKQLEEAIIRHPDNWLWSHRRWKHSKT